MGALKRQDSSKVQVVSGRHCLADSDEFAMVACGSDAVEPDKASSIGEADRDKQGPCDRNTGVARVMEMRRLRDDASVSIEKRRPGSESVPDLGGHTSVDLSVVTPGGTPRRRAVQRAGHAGDEVAHCFAPSGAQLGTELLGGAVGS